MTKERLYIVKLTAKELWELKCNFDMSVDTTDPSNALSKVVGGKLNDAWQKVPARGSR